MLISIGPGCRSPDDPTRLDAGAAGIASIVPGARGEVCLAISRDGSATSSRSPQTDFAEHGLWILQSPPGGRVSVFIAVPDRHVGSARIVEVEVVGAGAELPIARQPDFRVIENDRLISLTWSNRLPAGTLIDVTLAHREVGTSYRFKSP